MKARLLPMMLVLACMLMLMPAASYDCCAGVKKVAQPAVLQHPPAADSLAFLKAYDRWRAREREIYTKYPDTVPGWHKGFYPELRAEQRLLAQAVRKIAKKGRKVYHADYHNRIKMSLAMIEFVVSRQELCILIRDSLPVEVRRAMPNSTWLGNFNTRFTEPEMRAMEMID